MLRPQGVARKHKTRAFRTQRWEQRAGGRRDPAHPTLTARMAANREVALEQYEALHADGVSFALDEELAPWKRRSTLAAATAGGTAANQPDQRGLRFKFGGVRVRTVPTQPAPGFSTHWN